MYDSCTNTSVNQIFLLAKIIIVLLMLRGYNSRLSSLLVTFLLHKSSISIMNNTNLIEHRHGVKKLVMHPIQSLPLIYDMKLVPVRASLTSLPSHHAVKVLLPVHHSIVPASRYHNVPRQQRSNLSVENVNARTHESLRFEHPKYSHISSSDRSTERQKTYMNHFRNALVVAPFSKSPTIAITATKHKELDNCVKKEKFPKVLYQLLEDAGKNGNEDIVCFLPHGRSFIVKDIGKFETIVMPKYFKMSVWKSFRRQLNLYDFTRVTCGPDRGSYYHKSFVRGKPELLDDMKRSKLKGERSKNLPDYIAPKSPNFYLESEEEVG